MRGSILYILFFVSYSPLFFYLWIVNSHFPKKWIDIFKINIDLNDIYFLLGFLSIVVFFLIIESIKNTAPSTVNINKINERNDDFSSYVMTYFFAFIGLKITSLEEVVGVLFLFSFIAFIYSRSNLIYSNPILAIFGYNIYEGITESEKSIVIISKKEAILGVNTPLIKISKKIFFNPKI